jgi:DNA-binding MarR family transcriptional regulator
VTAVVDGLARRGLVHRGRVERDRRRVVLELTRVGRCLLRRADEVAEQHLSELVLAAARPDTELDQPPVTAGIRASGRARQVP